MTSFKIIAKSILKISIMFTAMLIGPCQIFKGFWTLGRNDNMTHAGQKDALSYFITGIIFTGFPVFLGGVLVMMKTGMLGPFAEKVYNMLTNWLFR